jgi:uncharacterized delta-60 repeat protein
MGASSSVTVTLSVASLTDFDVSGCQANSAGITAFGSVLPGTSAVTTSNCVLEFGSTNDSAMVRVGQLDHLGNAMYMSSWGPLDASYDPAGAEGAGKKLQDFNIGGNDEGSDIVQQSTGAVIVAGDAKNAAANADYSVARFDALTGALDATYGVGGTDGNGRTQLDFTGGPDWAFGSVVQSNDSVIVIGQSDNAGQYDTGMARFDSSGNLDATFSPGGTDGGNGRLRINYGGTDGWFEAVVLPDDSMIAAGWTSNTVGGGAYDFAVSKITKDGALDTTWSVGGTAPGGSGTTLIDFQGLADEARGIKLLPDGSVLVAGYTTTATGQDWGVAKLDPTGALDPTFGVGGADGNGKVTIDFSAGTDDVSNLELTSANELIVGGTSYNGANNDFAVAKLTAAGVLDPTFSPGGTEGNGKARIDFTTSVDRGWGLDVLPDGSIVVSGQTGSDFGLLKLTSAGALDTSFDVGGTEGDGKAKYDFAAGTDQGRAVLETVDGRLLVAGLARNGGNDDYAMVQLDSERIADYAGTWGAGANTFAVCLDSIANGAVADWTAAGAGNCITTNNAVWRDVPDSASLATGKVAHTTAPTPVGNGAVAALRFGVRNSSAQRPGSYVAPIEITIIAPNA